MWVGEPSETIRIAVQQVCSTLNAYFCQYISRQYTYRGKRGSDVPNHARPFYAYRK